MSKVIQNKGGIGMGAPYDIPGYEYDPVTDKFKDLATGKSFDKDGNAKLEDNKAFTVDTNGTIVVSPSATYDGMKKVTLSVNVAGGDLENNKDATIDVSTYTDPVEVTPTAGKDGMKKVTVSLSNMPEVETTKQATIDVSTYDPANKPVITPTAGKQSMAEVEITLSNIPSGGDMTVLPAIVGSDDIPSWINFDPDFGVDYADSIPPLGVEISLSIMNSGYVFLTATGDGVTGIRSLFTTACNSDPDKLDVLNDAYSHGIVGIAYTNTQFTWAGYNII